MESFSVLLVDDEKDFVSTLVKRIERRKLDVRGANSGEEALRLLDERPADVVLLDLKMAGLSGLETLQEIKRRHPLVEVIMLTGHASMDAALEGIKLGAFDYMMKPVDMEDLLYKLEDAYKKRALRMAKEKEKGTG